MRKLCTIAVLVLVAVVGSATLFAQSTTLTGRVVDPQGASVANAEITLLTTTSQRVRGTRSGADGAFTFDAVTPGEYVLLVRAPGFTDFTQPATVGATPATADVALQVAGLNEDVTVQGVISGTAATGKTNIPLRELPMTVQGVPSTVIQETGANDLVTALQNVPGVYAFTNYGVYEGYTFRGFLDLFPSLANQLVDGVRHVGNRINSQTINIERVEVLKGPSSALYGGGAIGATTNIIRKKPSAQPAYDFSAAVGSWGLGRGSMGATGRLGSTGAALYRVDIGAERKDGFRNNETNRLQVSPSLSWRFGANNQLNVYYTFNRDSFSGDAGIPLVAPETGDVANFFPDVPRDRNFRTPYDFAKVTDNNLQVAYARQFNDGWGFRNTFSARPVNDDYFITEFMFVEDDARTVYREYLQFKHHRRPVTNLAEVTGRIGGAMEQNLVFGWESQRFRNRTNTIPGGGVADSTPIDLFNPVETQGPTDAPLARVAHATDNTNAIYVQDHITLGAKVKAMVGGRYDIYRRTSQNNPVTGGVETEGPLLRRDAEAFTGRVGLVFQPTPLVDLYGSFANSFRPLTQARPDGSSLEPETGRQIEFGQRFHLAGDRLQVNTAIFHIVRGNVAFSRPGGNFDQASEVTSKGFEADLSTSIVSNWRINGGYGFTDVTFGEYLVNATTNLEGNSSIMAPRHTLNLWTSYDWASGFGVSLGLRAQSRMFIDRENTLSIGGFGLLNMAARYVRGPVEYALNINNLTDTQYFASVLYDTQLYPGEPINVLGTIRVRLR